MVMKVSDLIARCGKLKGGWSTRNQKIKDWYNILLLTDDLKQEGMESVVSNDPKTGYNYKLMDMTIGQNIRRKYLYFRHAFIPGIFYAKPVPPECKKALEARAWILSMVEREDLKNINEAEIIANLPQYVS